MSQWHTAVKFNYFHSSVYVATNVQDPDLVQNSFIFSRKHFTWFDTAGGPGRVGCVHAAQMGTVSGTGSLQDTASIQIGQGWSLDLAGSTYT